MKRRIVGVTVFILSVSALCWRLGAHCQIPCGIYDDEMRFTHMREHVATIEKSMNEIVRIGGENSPNHNQLVRWVVNKEEHAEMLTEIVTAYFMAQRIAPKSEGEDGYEKYVHEATTLHRMIVASMKATQTTDVAHCAELRRLIDDFENSYMEKEGSKDRSRGRIFSPRDLIRND